MFCMLVTSITLYILKDDVATPNPEGVEWREDGKPGGGFGEKHKCKYRNTPLVTSRPPRQTNIAKSGHQLYRF